MSAALDRAQLHRRVILATEHVTLSGLKHLCEAHTARPFLRKLASLEKFKADPSKGNHEDLLALQEFFETSETGHLLLTPPFDAPTASRLPPFPEILSALRSAHTRPVDAAHFDGAFLAYHGSYMTPDRYVIRAIRFQAQGGSIIAVTDFLDDKVSPTPDQISGTGAVSFTGDRPQIVLHRRDNSIGFNLIAGDALLPKTKTKGIVFIGQMTGVNRKGAHFSRAILLRKQADSIAALKEKTGIFRLDKLDKTAREEFAYLADELPTQAFSDPVLQMTTG